MPRDRLGVQWVVRSGRKWAAEYVANIEMEVGMSIGITWVMWNGYQA